jgi:hypothetical protein
MKRPRITEGITDDDDGKIIALLNEKYKSRSWFVCYECNKLHVDKQALHVMISECEMRPLCEKCVKYCPFCHLFYSQYVSYVHKHGDTDEQCSWLMPD